MKSLNPVKISGREVLPIIEGGKGVAVSNGRSSGAFAAAGAVGTFSGVNPDSYDENGDVIPQIYHGATRRERADELIAYAIRGGVTQAKIAHEVAGGQGRIHMNVLWEAGGTERILNGILEQAGELIDGVTCGAGMPYKVAEIASSYKTHYHPIISSARAFKALWKRAHSKFPEFLGSVVYEDPWLAGGHNGLTNSEDPNVPQAPYERVRDLRTFMNSVGLNETPIIMAGGVWYLRDWDDWLDNPEIGPIAFQFGSRPLLTQESPISNAWKARLMTLREGEISLNKFSPTGFYSSAVHNNFLIELEERTARQVPYRTADEEGFGETMAVGARARTVHLSTESKAKAEGWVAQGFTEVLRTPDDTMVFVTADKADEIRTDQRNCMCCLSSCRFSSWSQSEAGTTGKRPDPRSFCIQKTLQAVAHTEDTENQLMFSGHNGCNFAGDPFFNDGFIPTVAQLVERIKTGD